MNNTLLDGLNKEQKNAVTASLDRHILILAGAGCGKTTVLTRRIAFLVESGIDPGKILALTFTRKAADEMASRVSRLLCAQKFDKLPVITTFHGFALKVLSGSFDKADHFSDIGFQPNPRLINEKERLGKLVSLTTTLERKMLRSDLFGIDSLLAQKAVFPERLSKLDKSQSDLLNSIERRLQEDKESSGLWDFSDLLAGTLRLFRCKPSIAEFFALKFRVILIDEFQDTNPVQITLLKALLADNKYLFAVGDDDQAIYAFRGADIRPTLEFCSHFKGAEVLKLQINYRSTPSVLKSANKINSDKPAAYRKILVSGKCRTGSGPVPSAHAFDDQEQMLSWILKKASLISTIENVLIPSMAVLFRLNRSLQWVSEYLEKRSIDSEKFPALLTVHKSKGLEFPVVFLCDMEESVFPNYQPNSVPKPRNANEFLLGLFKAPQIDCNWDEEKRIFYVAVTRAEKHLFFLSVRRKEVYGRKKSFRPSRFLKMI
ncbi:MAG: ATP-dependent helicase [Fibrobacter sp.]|nr:ATP-dependent helicase [Fibrobacter sp.]